MVMLKERKTKNDKEQLVKKEKRMKRQIDWK